MFKYFPTKAALYRAIIQKRTNGSEEMFFPKEAIDSKDDRQVFRIHRLLSHPEEHRRPHFHAPASCTAPWKATIFPECFLKTTPWITPDFCPVHPAADQGKRFSEGRSLPGGPRFHRHGDPVRDVPGNLRIEKFFSFSAEKGRRHVGRYFSSTASRKCRKSMEDKE